MTTRHLGIAEALREAIAEEMTRDDRVFCIGEDIAVPGGWGGAFTVTLGLETKFPDRMINTPIAELGSFGVACGAAMAGMRPVAEYAIPWSLLNAAADPPQAGDVLAGLERPLEQRFRLDLSSRRHVGPGDL